MLVVRNLTRNVQEGHLEEIFKQFGVVHKVTLPTDPKASAHTDARDSTHLLWMRSHVMV